VSDSPHNENRIARAILAGVFVSALLTGCALRPWRIAPIPSGRDYTATPCEALDAEARAVESEIADQAMRHRGGTRQRIAILRGRAVAIDEQIIRKGCKVPQVNLLLVRERAQKAKPARLYY
jgi:hypothetical protein